MKRFIYATLLILITYSCKSSHEDNTKDFIPGTFTRSYKDESGSGTDTYLFSLLDERGNIYLITHRINYQLKIHGQLSSRVSKTEKSTGIYDAIHRQLHAQSKEMMFSFLPDKETLVTAAGTEFRKVWQLSLNSKQ